MEIHLLGTRHFILQLTLTFVAKFNPDSVTKIRIWRVGEMILQMCVNKSYMNVSLNNHHY